MKKEICINPKDSVFDYWRSLNTDPLFEEYAVLVEHHPLISNLSLLTGYTVFVLDHVSARYAFMHKNIENLSGWKPQQFIEGGWEFSKNMIPARERLFSIHLSHRLPFEYLYQLPIEKRMQVLYCKDYSSIHASGAIGHFFQKGMVLKMDAKGNIQLTLHIANDIGHLKHDNGKNNLVISGPADNNHIYMFDAQTQLLTDYGSLSKREKEILGSLEQKLESKEISSRLNISWHTVDTHRRNLLHKLNCVDTTALITFCKISGLIR